MKEREFLSPIAEQSNNQNTQRREHTHKKASFTIYIQHPDSEDDKKKKQKTRRQLERRCDQKHTVKKQGEEWKK